MVYRDFFVFNYCMNHFFAISFPVVPRSPLLTHKPFPAFVKLPGYKYANHRPMLPWLLLFLYFKLIYHIHNNPNFTGGVSHCSRYLCSLKAGISMNNFCLFGIFSKPVTSSTTLNIVHIASYSMYDIAKLLPEYR